MLAGSPIYYSLVPPRRRPRSSRGRVGPPATQQPATTAQATSPATSGMASVISRVRHPLSKPVLELATNGPAFAARSCQKGLDESQAHRARPHRSPPCSTRPHRLGQTHHSPRPRATTSPPAPPDRRGKIFLTAASDVAHSSARPVSGKRGRPASSQPPTGRHDREPERWCHQFAETGGATTWPLAMPASHNATPSSPRSAALQPSERPCQPHRPRPPASDHRRRPRHPNSKDRRAIGALLAL